MTAASASANARPNQPNTPRPFRARHGNAASRAGDQCRQPGDHQQRDLTSRAAPRPCAPAATGAISAAPSRARSPRPPPPAARRNPSAAPGNARNPRFRSRPGSIPACGHTSLSSSPARWTTSVPALGLTHSQSIPGDRRQACRCSRPRLESRARASASTSAESSWSIGSPPVTTTSRASSPSPHSASMCVGERRRRRRTCPRPRRRCRRNRCRRNCIAALARSCLAPRPQIAAGKAQEHCPAAACTPSPCRVRNASLTA